MHTAFKLFDFVTQSNIGNIDKIAAKLSNERDIIKNQTASDFLKVMGDLLHIHPDQV